MDGNILVIVGPVFTLMLSLFSMLIRANLGSVRKVGSDLFFAAASVEIGFFALDLKSVITEVLITDIGLFLIFACGWAGILLYLKTNNVCYFCNQQVEPARKKAIIATLVGYSALAGAILIRLWQAGFFIGGG